jgi:hypothetical protein
MLSRDNSLPGNRQGPQLGRLISEDTKFREISQEKLLSYVVKLFATEFCEIKQKIDKKFREIKGNYNGNLCNKRNKRVK